MTWAEICEDKFLNSVEWRVESDRWGNVVMSPPPRFRHVEYQNEIAHQLRGMMVGGRSYTECPVETHEGVKAVDAAWISDARRRSRPSDPMLRVAPEICVEVESPSNSHEEFMERKGLYFEQGAVEFWVCGLLGDMAFYDRTGEIPGSKLCPAFPVKIVLD